MFTTEKFSEIETHFLLHDTKSKNYLNREAKTKCWFEIENATSDDWDEIQVNVKDKRGMQMNF